MNMNYSLPEIKRQSYYYSWMNIVSTEDKYSPFRYDLLKILILLTDKNTEEDSRKYFMKFINKHTQINELEQFKLIQHLRFIFDST